MKSFRDAEHLLRLAAVFAIGLVAFLLVRGYLVPKSFGQLGHYRANAIPQIAARPISFAGRDACEACHSDVVEKKAAGKHAKLGCEGCHGPMAKHAEDPTAEQVKLPDVGVICARCHEKSAAKPKWFPQVVSEDHSNGVACDTCHQPHSPAIVAEETAKKK